MQTQYYSSANPLSLLEAHMKWILTLAVFTLVFSSPALANSTLDPVAQTAPVIVNGEVLFILRGVTAFPAKTRAKQVTARIEVLAEDENFDANTLQIVDEDDRSKIKAGDLTIVTVLDVDAELEGISRKILTITFRKKTREIIAEYRSDRTNTVLVKNSVYAAVATVILIVLLFGIRWGFRRLNIWMEKRLKRRIENLEAKSLRMVQAKQIWSAMSYGIKLIYI